MQSALPTLLTLFDLVYFQEKVLFSPLVWNAKIFALSSHVYFMMEFLTPMTKVFEPAVWFRLHIVMLALTFLGVALALAVVALPCLVVLAQCRMRPAGCAGCPDLRRWADVLQWRYWIPLSCLLNSSARRRDFVSILVAFGLSWSNILAPPLQDWDWRMVNTVTLLMRESASQSAGEAHGQIGEQGLQRFWGIGIGEVVGILLLTWFYRFWILLIAAGFVWQSWAIYMYYTSVRYRYAGLLMAAFCAMAMVPPLGLVKWENQLEDENGQGWAYANPYRRLIAEFLGVLLTVIGEGVFLFFNDRDRFFDELRAVDGHELPPMPVGGGQPHAPLMPVQNGQPQTF